jgi:type II secretory pathway component GspD/PulD (secretin)
VKPGSSSTETFLGSSVHFLKAVATALTLMAGSVCLRAQQGPPQALPGVAVVQLDLRQSHPELDGRRMSVGYPEPTPIKDVLLRLVRETRLSVILDPSLNQTFVGDLKNVTIREALDLILEPLGLDYSVRGQIIRVFRRELETRFYGVDYVIRERTGTDPSNLYSDLAEGVRSLLSADGRMNLDRTAALLQVTDRPSRLVRVEQYLEAVMLRSTRQVQIDAKVVEVELRDEFASGIDWRTAFGSLTRDQARDSSALLKALAAQGKVNVLASPRVMAMNNEPAVMRIGTQDVSFVGVVLKVTPQISADGIVHMSIHPSITERIGVAASPVGDTMPIVNLREADTLVRVRQGETIAIAGLLQGKTELVILLTPTIMGLGETIAAAQAR